MSSKLSCGSSRSRRSLAALVLVLVGCDQAPRARGVGGAVVAAPERSPTAAPALAPSAARPNILVIMSDDQRADTVRCMPRMARSLGAQGTTFTHHFASTPLCCPARSTFLTGLYPRHHGVLHNGDVEDPGDQDVDEGVAGAMLLSGARSGGRATGVRRRAIAASIRLVAAAWATAGSPSMRAGTTTRIV